jgi:hypothetical protein
MKSAKMFGNMPMGDEYEPKPKKAKKPKAKKMAMPKMTKKKVAKKRM